MSAAKMPERFHFFTGIFNLPSFESFVFSSAFSSFRLPSLLLFFSLSPILFLLWFLIFCDLLLSIDIACHSAIICLCHHVVYASASLDPNEKLNNHIDKGWKLPGTTLRACHISRFYSSHLLPPCSRHERLQCIQSCMTLARPCFRYNVAAGSGVYPGRGTVVTVGGCR